MNRARIVLLLAVGLAAPCLALAQTGADKKPQAAQMHEDVEVMRRILNRSLNLPRYSPHSVWVPGNSLGALGALGGSGGALGNPYGGLGGGQGFSGGNGFGGGHTVSVSTLEFAAVEGVYLKGHGAIFTLTLPPQQNLKPDAAVPSADKPLSEWERVRKEVRGEKVEDAAKPKKNPTVLDTLLKVLAENGTHLSQLAPDETVTIVVTFREDGGAKNAGQYQGNQWELERIGVGNILSRDHIGYEPASDGLVRIIRAATDSDANENAAQPKDVSAGATKEIPAAVKDSILLGELNFKQGKYKEAEKAYLTALKLLENSPDDGALHQVYQVLAQTYLADGKTEEAKNYLEKAIALEKKKASNPNSPKKEAKAASAVPAKLLVSAPKKLLDQVGSGKITFEEFKKEASVDFASSATPEK
jgi:tetratricopeptide (TPR) repeat protein